MIQAGNNLMHIHSQFLVRSMVSISALSNPSSGSRHQKVRASQVLHLRPSNANEAKSKKKGIHSLELLAVSPAGN